jgi:hypothetical protein
MKNAARRPRTGDRRLYDSVNKQARAANGTMFDAMMMAAEQVGENGRGKDGLFGYFRSVARRNPQLFLRLLAQFEKNPHDAPEVRYQTLEEAKEALAKTGIEIDSLQCGPSYKVKNEAE